MEQNQQQNQEQQEFKCTGDCYNCLKEDPVKRRNQWQYCAAQRTYDSIRMIGDMQTALNLMLGTVAELKAKIEAIQNSEANVLDTTQAPNIKENVGSNVESIIAQ